MTAGKQKVKIFHFQISTNIIINHFKGQTSLVVREDGVLVEVHPVRDEVEGVERYPGDKEGQNYREEQIGGSQDSLLLLHWKYCVSYCFVHNENFRLKRCYYKSF